MPRVLFSAPQCRVVVIDLERGERLGEHRVRERAVVEVIAGSVAIESSGRSVACAAGTLVTFEPGERHAVRACTAARLLLVLAPWPAADHYTEAEAGHGDPLPHNALLQPDESFDAPTE